MGPKIPIPTKIPLILSDDILLPGTYLRISVTNTQNVQLMKEYMLVQDTFAGTVIGIVYAEQEGRQGMAIQTLSREIHSIGTVAMVLDLVPIDLPKPCFLLSVIGLSRFTVERIIDSKHTLAVVSSVKTTGIFSNEHDANIQELEENFKFQVSKLLGFLGSSMPTTAYKLKKMLDVRLGEHIIYQVASIVHASFEEKMSVLDSLDFYKQMEIVHFLLKRHIEDLETHGRRNSSKIVERIPNLPDIYRFHTPGLNQLNSSFGNPINPQNDELNELEKKLENANIPPSAFKTIAKELQCLKRMTLLNAEKEKIRNYLEFCADLPWSKSSSEVLDIAKSRKDLDVDHYGMAKVKKRVLEYLAVRQLKNQLRGPILCFVGPPGVGKTSIGRSIAQSLGREFHRISLGGIANQTDIRGHRRTYVGAMPGRIIQGLKTVGVKNPVFLLDEIDKLCKGIQGDPAAALLEVLDPEQNCNFVDLYLNIPFDLSQVLFIATANSTKTIPTPLLDRLEVIYVAGYTQDEKLHIATRHLIPKQLVEHGLSSDVINIPEQSVKKLIESYTREAGVRSLERKIGALCRSVAVQVAEMDSENNENLPIVLDLENVEAILGPAMFLESDLLSHIGQPGIAVGLAWTAVGGDVLIVEANKMEGDGELVLTGHLGNVMKESATLALNWLRVAALKYGINLNGEVLSRTDIHIHVPAGGVEKDGPSAGITIATALISLFTGKPVSTDIAMTGEITLRGIVLPVGGVKEKVLAAHRAGIKRVILPQKSSTRLQDVSEDVKKDLTFVFVNHMDEVLTAAFDGRVMPVSKSEPNGTLISKL